MPCVPPCKLANGIFNPRLLPALQSQFPETHGRACVPDIGGRLSALSMMTLYNESHLHLGRTDPTSHGMHSSQKAEGSNFHFFFTNQQGVEEWTQCGVVLYMNWQQQEEKPQAGFCLVLWGRSLCLLSRVSCPSYPKQAGKAAGRRGWSRPPSL